MICKICHICLFHHFHPRYTFLVNLFQFHPITISPDGNYHYHIEQNIIYQQALVNCAAEERALLYFVRFANFQFHFHSQSDFQKLILSTG